jgi:hypothetical protein
MSKINETYVQRVNNAFDDSVGSNIKSNLARQTVETRRAALDLLYNKVNTMRCDVAREEAVEAENLKRKQEADARQRMIEREAARLKELNELRLKKEREADRQRRLEHEAAQQLQTAFNEIASKMGATGWVCGEFKFTK